MPVVIILAAAVILGGVVVVAMGRGGELGRERPELPVRSDFRTWSDVAGYRPPPALLGYHAGATEHALSLIARTIAERDAEIDWLRKRLVEVVRPEPMRDEHGSEELAGLGPGAGPDTGPGAEAGHREVAGDSAPGYEAELLGQRPGEGE